MHKLPLLLSEHVDGENPPLVYRLQNIDSKLGATVPRLAIIYGHVDPTAPQELAHGGVLKTKGP